MNRLEGFKLRFLWFTHTTQKWVEKCRTMENSNCFQKKKRQICFDSLINIYIQTTVCMCYAMSYKPSKKFNVVFIIKKAIRRVRCRTLYLVRIWPTSWEKKICFALCYVDNCLISSGTAAAFRFTKEIFIPPYYAYESRRCLCRHCCQFQTKYFLVSCQLVPSWLITNDR